MSAVGDLMKLPVDLKVPQVSDVSRRGVIAFSGQTGADKLQQDLYAFHHRHFSQDAVDQFEFTFLNLGEQPALHDSEIWAETDDLGYYKDGVKRTLTDEQIEIFRHSELEALRRKREGGLERKNALPDEDATQDIVSPEPEGSEEIISQSKSRGGNARKKKRKGGQRRPVEPKPDLRKRTWDVVEAGLDSLDYD